MLTFYFPPEREPGRDDLRRLRLHPRPVSRPAGFGPERLRAGAVPPRSAGRLPRPAGRRAGHRPVQADPRRALRPGQGPLRRRAVRRGRRGARAAVRRLHAPRRHRQGRGADAPPDQHPRGPAAQDRPVLRGRQGEVARAGPQLRPVARDRQGLPRHQGIRAGHDRLARPDRGQLPGGRPGRRAAAPARQDARGASRTWSTSGGRTPRRPRSRATSSASRRSWSRRPRRRSPTRRSAASWPPPGSPARSYCSSRSG